MSSVTRHPHMLRREKTLTIPRHIVFIDTETKPQTEPDGSKTHKLILGWACHLRLGGYDRRDKKDWFKFADAAEFWKWLTPLCTSKLKLWVIAHNIGFDFTVLQGLLHLRQAGFKCKFFCTTSSTTLIRVKKRGSSIFFIDFRNWFNEPLAILGERIDLKKLEIDFDATDPESLSTYCHRDVEILIEMFVELTGFLRTKRIARLSPTIGSLAFAAYLFRDYRIPIYIHNNSEAIDLERAAYKGGRTECFYIGELSDGPYYCLDVNSLYPYVMQINHFPTKYVQIVHNLAISDLRALLKTKSIVAQVTLDTNKPIYAYRGERTLFPTGTFSTTLTTPELQYAANHGHIKAVNRTVIYDNAPIFTSFVERFYDHRKHFTNDGNPLYAHFCKVIMNSLYGKFGQKAEQWEKIGDCPGEPDRIETFINMKLNKRMAIRYLLGEVFEQTGWTETINSFPAIAAHITAYARMFLWNLMYQCGQGNYFYCDTDSLFVNTEGFKNLAHLVKPKEIGKLKVESVANKLTIYSLKDYEFGNKTVIKGIRKNAVKKSDVTYEQEKWPTIKGILRTNKPDHYPILKTTKHLYRDYRKGVVDSSGVVHPLQLDEPDSTQQSPF